MNEDVKTGACLKGLTAACFREQPAYAKRMFAYRLLQLLVGEQVLKRMQTIPGVDLEAITEPTLPGQIPSAPPVSPAPPISLVPSVVPVLPAIPIVPVLPVVPPNYVTPWEPGPNYSGDGGEGGVPVPEILKAKIDFATAATHEIIAGVAGFKINITSIAFTVAGETNLTLKSAATAVSGAMDFGGTNEPRGLTHGMADYGIRLTSGEAFNITSSAAVQVSGYVGYYLS